jgi:serine/threonine protein kinase
VAHRDLKLDNVLLDAADPPRACLCDFGFARDWDVDPQMSTIRGTPDYMAPELCGAKTPPGGRAPVRYDATKTDVWALGVLLCATVLGLFPYEGERLVRHGTPADPLRALWRQQAVASWRGSAAVAAYAAALSPALIDLLDRMLDRSAASRITTAGIKAHPWFTQPLGERHQRALNYFEAKQADVEAQARALAASSPHPRALAPRAPARALPLPRSVRAACLALSFFPAAHATTTNRLHNPRERRSPAAATWATCAPRRRWSSW